MHICYEHFDQLTGQWGPNLQCFISRIASHPERLENIYFNSILLLRDLLYFHELDCAVSSGDFGRVELLRGDLTRMFAGAGSKNYANELLHLIQNFTYVWGPFG